MEGSGSPQWGLVDRAEGRYDDRNQDSQRQPPMRSSASQPPGYGLLSRTLIHSPVVKKILPARVRRPDLNDVVFIGVGTVTVHRLNPLTVAV